MSIDETAPATQDITFVRVEELLVFLEFIQFHNHCIVVVIVVNAREMGNGHGAVMVGWFVCVLLLMQLFYTASLLIVFVFFL